MKYASGRDKVQGYLEANEWWEKDRLIQSCHGKQHVDDKSREGRKLDVAGYYKKMQHTPFKPKSRLLIPDYVIPSDKKRENVRYNIRMKMLLASGIQFPSSLDA